MALVVKNLPFQIYRKSRAKREFPDENVCLKALKELRAKRVMGMCERSGQNFFYVFRPNL